MTFAEKVFAIQAIDEELKRLKLLHQRLSHLAPSQQLDTCCFAAHSMLKHARSVINWTAPTIENRR